LALAADLLAHREATDSSLVWEPQARALLQRAGAPQQRQVWPRQQQAQEKLRVARPPARQRAASRWQELGAALQE
jgi:hypothetical protein